MERRGRPKEEPVAPTPLKFTRVYTDEQCTEVWVYDLTKFPFGPIHTEIRWKKGFPPKPIKRKRKTKEEMQYEEILNKVNPIKNAKKNKNTRGRRPLLT